MRNLTITKRESACSVVAFAAVAVGSLLMLQANIELATTASGAEVEGEMIAIPAAPAAITGVMAPELSDEARAAERELAVRIKRTELRFPEAPAIALDEVRAKAEAWLGDGTIAAPTDEIRVEAPGVIRDQSFEATLEVPQLERPELPSPLPVR